MNRTASDRLPVYVNKLKGGSLEVTVVRKIRGNAAALQEEFEFLCKSRVRCSVSPASLVVARSHEDGLPPTSRVSVTRDFLRDNGALHLHVAAPAWTFSYATSGPPTSKVPNAGTCSCL